MKSLRNCLRVLLFLLLLGIVGWIWSAVFEIPDSHNIFRITKKVSWGWILLKAYLTAMTLVGTYILLVLVNYIKDTIP